MAIDMKKERIVYLDLLRIVSGILVVMVHVSAMQIERLSVWSAQYAAANAFNCLAFSGVPLFVMISGALTLDPGKETGLKSLLVHKTLRFFALYYVWKAIYQIVTVVQAGKEFTSEVVKNDILLALVQQRGYYHLWFLPMIAIIYMSVPLIKKGTADKNVCIYFLSVYFFVKLLFPTLFHYDFKFKYLLVDFFGANDFYIFGGYLGYFILGHYLHHWNDAVSNGKRRILYAVGGGSFILACILGTAASRSAGEPSYLMNTPFAVTTFFMSAAIYTAIRAWCQKTERAGKTERVYRLCADRVFGIYLFHPLVIELFCAIGLDQLISVPALSVLFMVVCVFAVSLIVSQLLSKIPLINRLIM